MHNSLIYSFLFVLILITSGCVNTGSLDTFRNYDEHFNSSDKKLYVLTDCFVFDDVSGKQHTFNSEYNKSLCLELTDVLKKEFAAVNITNYEIISITGGLQAGVNKYVESVQDGGEEIYLPLYFSENRITKKFEPSYSEIADGLGVSIASWKNRETYIRSLSTIKYPQFKWLNLPENVQTMFILTDGVRVPVGKSIGQGVATAVLTLGTVTAFQHTLISTKVVIINSYGKPVWGDVVFRGSSLDSSDEIKSFMKQLFKHYPKPVLIENANK